MQVIVNKSEMERSGNKILQLSEEYNDKIKEIRNIVSIIESNWVGDDAVAYKEMITEKCIPNLEKIKQMIDQYGTYLKKVPEVYYAIDSSCLNKGNRG